MSFSTLRNARHRAPIWMIAFLGTALSIAGWFVVSRLEDRTSASEFNLRANNSAARISGLAGNAS